MIFFTVLSAAAQDTLALRVVEGGGAINSIRNQRGHDPVVQVVDQSERPVSGAIVTFVLPASGASAAFGDGSLSLTATTDDRGMATGRGLKPNRVAGQFRIRATASMRGASGHTTILQTNAEPATSKGKGKWVVIAIAVGGAVAGGAAAAAHGGSSGAASSGNTGTAVAPTSISSGTPSFGPPK